jgi:hypothetical protein
VQITVTLQAGWPWQQGQSDKDLMSALARSIILLFNTQICTLMSALADAQLVFFQSCSYKVFFSSYHRSDHIVAYMLPAHD